ncbi:MAG TPA: nucleotide pyrophosphohydrolase [Candidatus Thermoplasmatota archaeon]|nr:nucleotide pyrophosphohydrolase [Candidatus Thermoplasmatota archaeon]
MPADPLEALRRDLRAFVDERDWAQFHAPKDLAAAVSVEAGELLEEFLWKPDVPADRRAAVAAEAADVYLYLLLLADRCGFDLVEAARAKLEANRAKYPVEKARGSAAKYDRL